ncbi:MAG TPA: small acid-soluble spore protein SspI [Bacilli bacterium]|nr:small acid-soluble spore protein SspI [Bacilli bacterium]
MDLDIRKNIIKNTKDDSIDDLIKSLDESIPSDDELILPGLGVFFEILWQDLNNDEKIDIVTKIKGRLI